MSGPSVVVADRPAPAIPRPYTFPAFARERLSNGLTCLLVDLPGRPLVSASLVMRRGAVDEAAGVGGATVLAARALSEGTERFGAVELVEAAERLGASLHADAGWDATTAGVEVPAARLGPALELLAELVRRPTFPAAEVERLRDERLNDILQARADPRRRAEEAFVETIYEPGVPYRRPAGGLPETVAGLDRDALAASYGAGIDPSLLTLVVGGDLAGMDVVGLAEPLFGDWAASPSAEASTEPRVAGAVSERFVRIIHRPGAVQTEIRIGHVGLPRRIDDFHAVVVMTTLLGGLFNSRLNSKLREEKGYTYGASASFDMRRGAGPFAARAAVNTEATAPAIVDTLAELTKVVEEPVADAELVAARDFLVGVFPLRFETPGPVVGSIAGLVVQGLPDDELQRYRPAVEAVGVDQVLAAARAHIHPERAAIVLVGDADVIAAPVEAAGVGPVVVDRSDVEGAVRTVEA
ncbi:MAG TPA: pitrilysin family protein [Candidatus Dormibacteraeota bacterium]|nr:pitrilysin family protein [Candidatus Dormibacteraeota bacterium]